MQTFVNRFFCDSYFNFCKAKQGLREVFPKMVAGHLPCQAFFGLADFIFLKIVFSIFKN